MGQLHVDYKLIIFLISLPMFFISLAVHEFSHAYFANKFGDDTAKRMGRLTLNPFKHIDLIGSVFMPLASFFSGFALLGWAKPVPVNSNNFRNQRKDDAIVALMGPVSNLLLCFLFATISLLIGEITLITMDTNIISFATVLWYGVLLNLFLFFFNLLPVPPLDGFHILHAILYNKFTFKLMQFGIWGSVILMVFIYSPLWKYFITVIFFFFGLLKNIFI